MVKSLELLSAEQLCDKLQVSRELLARLQKQKLIPVTRLGHRTLRYSPDDVARALEKLTVKAVAA